MSEHTHDFSLHEWLFLDSVEATAMCTVGVADGTLPVLVVSHDTDDGMWQFLCGTTNDPKDGLMACIGCVVEQDRSLFAVADLPRGWIAWRDAPGEPWRRELDVEESD